MRACGVTILIQPCKKLIVGFGVGTVRVDHANTLARVLGIELSGYILDLLLPSAMIADQHHILEAVAISCSATCSLISANTGPVMPIVPGSSGFALFME